MSSATQSAARLGARPPRIRWGHVGWYALAAAIAIPVLTPVARFYGLAVADGGAGLDRLAGIPNVGGMIWNTVVLALCSTVVAVVMALILAKCTFHVPQRYRGIASVLPIIPLAIPAIANVIGWAFLFSPNVGYANWFLRQTPLFDHLTEGPFDAYSFTSIVLVTGVEFTGLVYTFVYGRMQELSGSLESAARLCGASPTRSFLTVTIPLLRPSLVAAVVVTLMLGLGQFTAPQILGARNGIDVISTEMFRIRETFPIDYALTAALGVPLLVVGVVAVVLQRVVVGDQRRYVTTQSRGGRAVSVAPSRTATAVLATWTLLTVILPIVAIVVVALSPYWAGDLSANAWTTRQVTETLADPEVLAGVKTSAVTGVLAAMIALPLGFIGALSMTTPFRAPRVPQVVLDATFLAPLAVPRAAVGLAILFVFIQPPFSLYGSPVLFVLGYVLIVMPFALRTQHASLIGVGTSLYEASRISGAGYLRTIWEIAIPLARRGMAAALTIMVILLAHDFAVSVMLRTPGNHVMGSLLYEFWETGSYPKVAVMSLVITGVTAVGLAIAYRIGGRSALEKV
jgi:iron(III) transport system permease protein